MVKNLRNYQLIINESSSTTHFSPVTAASPTAPARPAPPWRSARPAARLPRGSGGTWQLSQGCPGPAGGSAGEFDGWMVGDGWSGWSVIVILMGKMVNKWTMVINWDSKMLMVNDWRIRLGHCIWLLLNWCWRMLEALLMRLDYGKSTNQKFLNLLGTIAPPKPS